MTRTLRLAVPNKGRLEQPTAALLRDAGLVFEKTERALSVSVRNVDLELLFVRADDIPEMVADGVAELGVTGQDLLAEHGNGLPVLAELGYGRCRLVAAVPRSAEAEKAEDFAGFRVATSHPNVTSAFFAEIYRAGIKSIDRSQWEGGKAIGMTQGVLMRRIILPQAIRRMIPPFMERSFELMKGTTNVSAIAFGDLLYRALELSARLYRPIEILSLVALFFFVMLTLTSILVRYMENRLDAARL